ncbi:NSS family neurotransmitter:Na+ symporter [Alkalibacillus filiformis]|uniref:NSS family neurotransmitter:Na+ symporter n=1 Tax=Alkalibacillus filiformis TaxID=200990 RepID=A0ABU0DWN8_9BACI|nr:sodium-dependent transporter [Alkalibacillus filiformis]MDQ0352816.1 NSS family neurotransmitter:Na+ symporter [Alkalibacillus filiformis]
MQGREQWATRLGFILAAVGSAVGLGNIWRFSYVLGEGGGFAFLIAYIICIFLIGLPVLLAEITVGRKGQSDAIGSFEKIAPGKWWKLGGILGVLSGSLILSFYGVIAGWVFYYVFSYLSGSAGSVEQGGYADYFLGFIGGSGELGGVLGPVFWQLLFMAVVIGVVYFGVKKGIELANRTFMPLLALLVVILAIYGLTMDGAGEAMNFMFSPDFGQLGNMEVWGMAIGQAFFTLSLGMGAMITYASYLPKETKLPSAAGTIVTLDTLFAIFAGLMIFPIVFTFGLDPSAGPELIFITLPEAFGQWGTGGTIFGILFFFLVGIAALSSAISLLEVGVSWAMRKFDWSRRKAALTAGIIIAAFGVPSALSQGGPLSQEILGLSFLDLIDTITDQYTLALGGMITALFVGWGWNKIEVLRETGLQETTIGAIWIWFLRIVAPVGILYIVLNNFYNMFIATEESMSYLIIQMINYFL